MKTFQPTTITTKGKTDIAGNDLGQEISREKTMKRQSKIGRDSQTV
ncbi:MAG TPA: hypothetical protein VER14_02410 [Phototrophicaceae bacterium]|nr:hypothetical protein [Phototrophicaceae bacterium]